MNISFMDDQYNNFNFDCSFVVETGERSTFKSIIEWRKKKLSHISSASAYSIKKKCYSVFVFHHDEDNIPLWYMLLKFESRKPSLTIHKLPHIFPVKALKICF